MQKTQKSILLFLCAVLALSFCLPGYAHPGGLDKNGGHKDKKNISGLGSYHYHCGDHKAHLHGQSGLCPYSKAYEEHRQNVLTLKEFFQKTAEDPELLTEEAIQGIQSMLVSPHMPFRLTEEILAAPDTDFGVTNVKGLNVRQKPSTKAGKVCVINVTGTPVLVTESSQGEWCRIRVQLAGKSHEGYVQQKMLDRITRLDYIISLGDAVLSLKEPF